MLILERRTPSLRLISRMQKVKLQTEIHARLSVPSLGLDGVDIMTEYSSIVIVFANALLFFCAYPVVLYK